MKFLKQIVHDPNYVIVALKVCSLLPTIWKKKFSGASLACVPGGFPMRPSFPFCEYGIKVYSCAKAYLSSDVKKRGGGEGKKTDSPPSFSRLISVELSLQATAADLFLNEVHERKQTKECVALTTPQ